MLSVILGILLIFCVIWWVALGTFLFEKPGAIHNKKFMSRAIIPYYLVIERLWDKK